MMSETARVAVMMAPCPYCGVGPGHSCVRRPATTRGLPQGIRMSAAPTGPATWPHAARLRPIDQGWLIGFRAGTDQVVDDVARMIDRGEPAARILELLRSRWSW